MRARLARVDAVLVQALIAAALSFAHLHDLAMAAGQDGWKAWAYPVSVDLLLVAAWRRLRSGTTKAAAWCWFVTALTASLGANVATAGLLDLGNVPAWLRILVAGWPAVAFLGGTLLAHTAPKTDPAPGVIEDQEDESEAAPEPPAQPVIEAPPQHPPVPVPSALVDHARKVAAEHHARTGAPIDTLTLRARLGVPVPMAEAIAAHL
ncbi:mobile element transfer protein SpdA [Streptomyces hygroscopicus subsp. jinggangensis 5008]|nr:mobile element transfer protein SpdA [Streptomyces hygroscopicus subsp. jinggangensis 5008]AGF64507.1 mobile element transfer protein SpdA [Streptomyces hygroscopicus subsp. jinggangensis TL01]